MLWAAYIALIFTGLFCRNLRAYDFCVIVFMGLLAWFNTKSADYMLYLSIYANPASAVDVDFGWIALCQVGRLLGLSYNGFACVVVVLSLLLYREFAKKINGNTSLILALFLVYPGIISLVQFRQFVASTIGCLAIAFLCTNSKRNVIWYLALVVCATLIHRTAVIFLLAILGKVFFACEKRGRLIIGFIVAFGLLFAVANAERLATSMFGEFRTSTYLTAGNGELAVGSLGALRNVLFLVFMALCPYFCCKIMAQQANSDGSVASDFWDWNIGQAQKCIALINICLLAITPFVLITNDFMRFERHGFTLAVALFSMMPELKNRHILLSCKAFYLAICIVFGYFYAGVVFDTVYSPILTFYSVPAFFV